MMNAPKTGDATCMIGLDNGVTYWLIDGRVYRTSRGRKLAEMRHDGTPIAASRLELIGQCVIAVRNDDAIGIDGAGATWIIGSLE